MVLIKGNNFIPLPHVFDVFRSEMSVADKGDGKFEIQGTNNDDHIDVFPGFQNNELEIYLNGSYHSTLSNVEELTINSKDGNDDIWVHAHAEQFVKINGGKGDDLIQVKQGQSYIHGGSGDDVIQGGRNNDMIFGDSGNDIIEGESGNDRLYGGGGHDTISDAYGNNFIDGGRGNDEINAVSTAWGSSQTEDHVHDYHGQNKISVDLNDSVLVNRSTSFENGGVRSPSYVGERGSELEVIKNRLEQKYKIKLTGKWNRQWSYAELAQLENALRIIPEKLTRSIQGYTFQRMPYRPGDNRGAHETNGLHQASTKTISLYDSATYEAYTNSTGIETTVIQEVSDAYERERTKNL